jgi:hypothetical protein
MKIPPEIKQAFVSTLRNRFGLTYCCTATSSVTDLQNIQFIRSFRSKSNACFACGLTRDRCAGDVDQCCHGCLNELTVSGVCKWIVERTILWCYFTCDGRHIVGNFIPRPTTGTKDSDASAGGFHSRIESAVKDHITFEAAAYMMPKCK